MLSVRYASFFYGIIIASLTWAFSLYLYLRLSQNDDIVNPTMFVSDLPKVFKESYFDQSFKQKQEYSNHVHKSDKRLIDYKHQYDVKSKNDYKNSDKLLQELQPIPMKPSVTIGQGLDELGLVRNMEEQKKREEGYKDFAFNILVSDSLTFDRELPDTRHNLCKNLTYEQNLPNASIVICFYNEHYKTLLRSLYSIINRTPRNLLHEIILVNDYSDSDTLHEQIKNYVNTNFKSIVKYYKTERREGLIRARMFGAKKASGDVLIFLDSHIEVNAMWIEPLLDRIKHSKNIVSMPVIDIINADTFQYSSSPLVRGGFNWGLHFKWDSLPVDTLKSDEDFIKPIKSVYDKKQK